MDFKIHETKNTPIAELNSDVKLENLSDFLDLIGNANYLGATSLIIREQNLSRDFFDLKTRIAGDILQKFSTYNLRLAIIGEFEEIESKSLKYFIRESNRVGRILFVENLQQAKLGLSKA